jgi:hypothetical protein
VQSASDGVGLTRHRPKLIPAGVGNPAAFTGACAPSRKGQGNSTRREGGQSPARGIVDAGGPPPSDVVVDDTMRGSNVVAGGPVVEGAVDGTSGDAGGGSERIIVAWSSRRPARSVTQTATINIVTIVTASRRCADVTGSPLRPSRRQAARALDAIGITFLPCRDLGAETVGSAC